MARKQPSRCLARYASSSRTRRTHLHTAPLAGRHVLLHVI